MAVQMRDPRKAAGLFEGWEETMIWSCLQNVMGSVYADSLEHQIGRASCRERV